MELVLSRFAGWSDLTEANELRGSDNPEDLLYGKGLTWVRSASVM
jgi:hypothetical protein